MQAQVFHKNNTISSSNYLLHALRFFILFNQKPPNSTHELKIMMKYDGFEMKQNFDA